MANRTFHRVASLALAFAFCGCMCGGAAAAGNAGGGHSGGNNGGGGGGVQLPAGQQTIGMSSANGINSTSGSLNNNYQNQNNQQALPPEDPAVAAAEDALATARLAAHRAQDAFDNTVSQLKAEFEKSDDYTAAVATMRAAQVKYDTAAAAAKASLAANGEYQAALKDKTDAAQKLATARNGGDTDAISAAATAALEANSRCTKLESKVLSADATTTAAKADMDAAGVKVRQMRADFDSSLKTKDEWLAARKAIDDSRTALATAQAKLAEVTK